MYLSENVMASKVVLLSNDLEMSNLLRKKVIRHVFSYVCALGYGAW